MLAGSIPVTLAALFAWNGLETSWRTPESGTTTHEPETLDGEVTVVAWNLAKCGFHRGGASFKTTDEVRAHLRLVADVLREESADLCFLSEVVFEALPCPVNQVAFLAEEAGFHAWAYGDNYSFGLPFARIRSGNAILSRVPLTALRVDALKGAAPFWNPTGTRRLLWAEVDVPGGPLPCGPRLCGPLLCGSVRNDSFDLAVNAAQVSDILSDLPDRPVLLAGDFNAEPETEPFRLWRESGRFLGPFTGPPTYPAAAPSRRIDTVLLPAAWPKGFEQRVLDVDLSDHEPVVVRARTP